MSKAYEQFSRLLKASVSNLSQSFFDSFAEANAKIRYKAGLKTQIIRKQIGKCCDWCSKMTGVFDIDNAPDGIYQRHLYCKCIVTTYSDKKFIDAWNKREFNHQIEARKIREQEILAENEKKNYYLKEKRIAKSSGSRFFDVTEEWKANKNTQGSVTDGKYFKIDNKKYYIGDPGVVMDHSDEEKRIAKLITDNYGGNMILLPRIVKPEYIKCADYFYIAEYWDLKSIEGKSKDVLYNAAHRKKDQAKNFVYDVSKCDLSENEIIKQAENLFYRKYANFVQRVMIVKNGKVEKVLERI